MVDISIIIPVYNAGSLLSRCLESIVTQYPERTYEVICVDDGSTDDSLSFAADYELNYPNVKILRHEYNQGLSKARSTGIKNAKGRYIMHVDADDWILPDTLNILFEKCIHTDADVIVYNYLREYENGNRSAVNSIKKEFFTQDKFQVQHLFYGTCVNKLVKRSVLEDICYGQIAVNTSEDLLYSFEVLIKARTFLLLPDSLYVYFQNKKSLTHQFVSENFLDQQTTVLQQLELVFQQYRINPILTKNLLAYNYKWLYLNLAKSMFWVENKKVDIQLLTADLKKFRDIDEALYVNWLKSLQNKYYALYLVWKHFGYKISFGILVISFFKKLGFKIGSYT